MAVLEKISITCFFASYLLVFLLELCRAFWNSEFTRSRIFLGVMFVATTAGLFAHSAFLAHHGGVGARGFLIENWFGWCLAVSWLLVIFYLWIFARQSNSVMGLFLFPAVLALILLGYLMTPAAAFTTRHVRSGWNIVHGGSLLLGTAIVALGFALGVVYLVQSYRLKRKAPTSAWFRLPSLEWLQQSAERSLLISAVLLGIGLMSGVVIAQFPLAAEATAASEVMPKGLNLSFWSDPVVWTSAVLFGWLVAATTFNLVYRPARQGRKVAYLVLASFLFLLIELVIVWWVGHATHFSPAELSLVEALADVDQDFVLAAVETKGGLR